MVRIILAQFESFIEMSIGIEMPKFESAFLGSSGCIGRIRAAITDNERITDIENRLHATTIHWIRRTDVEELFGNFC